MTKCEGCGKEYKTDKGLMTHSLKCEGLVIPFTIVKVERKQSKRGRPTKAMPGMDALAANWESLEVGATYPLPNHEGDDSHSDVTLSRYHFKKRAVQVGLTPGEDYSIESHDVYGATITRKK